MKNTKARFSVLAMLSLISMLSMVVVSCTTKTVSNFEECVAAGNPIAKSKPPQCTHDGKTFIQGIYSFDECAAAATGFPIIESYPRQCIAFGKTFVEQINNTNDFLKRVETPMGELTLSYSNGNATLGGVLERSVPCVEYQVDAISTRDLPISYVSLNVYNRNKGVMCIQILGEPQEIDYTIQSVSKNTHYIVKFEDEELFSGRLGD